MIATTDPARGIVAARFKATPAGAIEQALDAAVRTQREWRRQPAVLRAGVLRVLAARLRAEAEELAALITLEMGKPLGEARAEIEKCAVTCDFFAERGPLMVADTPIPLVPGTFIAWQPLGVVLAIMPWNYPFWQVVRFLAPALVAGNGAILKHAANVPQCALAIARLALEAGVPEGLFANLFVEPADVARLIADDRIAAVTVTGSTQVGAIVAGQAGAALKKQVLELGGSDPFVVLADADLERAAQVAVTARFTNAGQSCVNAKRFIVEEAVADRFVEAFSHTVGQLRCGDPAKAGTTLGPLARENLRDAIHGQVRRSLAAGAKLVAGGDVPYGAGYYYPATILDGVQPGMPAFDEETFGPAAAIVRARDAAEAIVLANRTRFGLGASIWTADTARGTALAREIEAGAVFVNALVASDPRVPFGGIKQSGYGRELSDLGLREFTNAKSIRVQS